MKVPPRDKWYSASDRPIDTPSEICEPVSITKSIPEKNGITLSR